MTPVKPELALFIQLIKERCGLLIKGNNEETLARALNERIGALGINRAAYLAHLTANPAEFQELVNLITINETYFFREPDQISLFVNKMAPDFLVLRAGRTPVRVLCAGCSSGEEPYSLAMALADKYGEAASKLFAFTGVDIDSKALAKARAGHYTRFSFRGVPAGTLERYFDKQHSGYALKAYVKNLVEFHVLNLLEGTFPPSVRDFDIIFFRNVSIYFDLPTRKVIQGRLASIMKDDGVLFLGATETLANNLGVLSLVEDSGLYYFVKKEPETKETAVLSASTEPPVASATPPAASLDPPVASPERPAHTAEASAPLEAARRLTREKRYDEAIPLLDQTLAVRPQDTEALLLKAHVLLNRKDFSAAEQMIHAVLQIDAWSADAQFLLGLAARWRKHPEEAISWFKQVVYAHPACWPAHYYLADLYRNNGETELARRSYRVVVQLLAGRAPDTGISHVPLDLPPEDIRFLCEHQLARLPRASEPAKRG